MAFVSISGRKYCSTECVVAADARRRKEKSTKAKPCKWCGKEVVGKGKVYCSKECLSAKIAAGRKNWQEVRRKNSRNRLAKALRMWRHKQSKDAIAEAVGVSLSVVNTLLWRSAAYRRLAAKRKARSTWHETEITHNARSKEFRAESHFRSHAVALFESRMFNVREEVWIPGTKRRIDLIVESGLFRFGVELKNGNRTARLDQTLGQAIVKCHAFGGLIPVCAVPDDVKCDKVFLAGCASVGAIAGTVTDCLKAMLVRSCHAST